MVPFEYSDLSGSKRRPACIVSSDEYNGGGRDVILAMVTSRLTAGEVGDVVVRDWSGAGLLRPSVIRTGRLIVLERRLLPERPLGTLGRTDLDAVDDGLKAVFGL